MDGRDLSDVRGCQVVLTPLLGGRPGQLLQDNQKIRKAPQATFGNVGINGRADLLRSRRITLLSTASYSKNARSTALSKEYPVCIYFAAPVSHEVDR
jgi:hypothetical protein